MRLFINYASGVLRTKTERLDLPDADGSTTADYLIDLIAKKLNKPENIFCVRFVCERIPLRLTRGWKLEHYRIEEGATLVVQFYENWHLLNEIHDSPNHKFLESILPETTDPNNNKELESIEQQQYNQQCLNDEAAISTSSFLSSTSSIQNNYHALLQIVLKQAKKGDLASVSSLIRDHPKQTRLLNQIGEQGWAVIHFAVFYEHLELFRFLLVKGADVNIVSADGWSPLMIAVKKRNFTIFNELLQHPKIDVNLVTFKGSALHLCAKSDLATYIRQLVRKAVDVDLTDEQGMTAIQLCPSNASESKELLIKQEKQSDAVEIAPIPEGPVEDLNNPPISIGTVLKVNSILYNLQERYLVCNPYVGALVRYNSKSDCPKKPKQTVPLTSIRGVKILREKDQHLFMRKGYYYFQVFCPQRIIYATTSQKLAEEWVKTIFIAYRLVHKKQVARPTKEPAVRDFDIPQPAKESVKNYRTSHIMKTPGAEKKLFEKPEPIFKKQAHAEPEARENRSNSKTFSYRAEPARQSPESPLSVQTHEPSQSTTIEKDFKLNEEQNSGNKPDNLKDNSTKPSFSIIPEEIEPPVNLATFKIIRTLGEGAFGKVLLVRHLRNNKVYALKSLLKKNLILNKQLKTAISQVNILKQCKHPFMVSLHWSFQTPTSLYMCLDYCDRGDLSEYLARQETLSESDARNITAQLVLIIQYLHEQRIIYRDLKPENILLCSDGFVKLADFGLSKHNPMQKLCMSFCGSPAYLSPEMLAQQGTSKEIDIYGIGCVLYEMLSGLPPYYSEDMKELYKNIKEAKLKYPANISSCAKDLLEKLLRRDPAKRINIVDLKKHPFFQGLDFYKIKQKQQGACVFPSASGENDPDSDEEEYELTVNFKDRDYDENNKRVNRVIGFSFSSN